jgi:hypothetical protein
MHRPSISCTGTSGERQPFRPDKTTESHCQLLHRFCRIIRRPLHCSLRTTVEYRLGVDDPHTKYSSRVGWRMLGRRAHYVPG